MNSNAATAEGSRKARARMAIGLHLNGSNAIGEKLMNFHETHQQVLDGTKTQTRRLVKEGEWASRYESIKSIWGQGAVYAVSTIRRLKWEVGRTYAVQPGRGKPQIRRIKLLAIRKERLQEIESYEIDKEGIPGRLATYTDDEGFKDYDEDEHRSMFAELWDSIHPRGSRWEDNPLVWVLEFELFNGGDPS